MNPDPLTLDFNNRNKLITYMHKLGQIRDALNEIISLRIKKQLCKEAPTMSKDGDWKEKFEATIEDEDIKEVENSMLKDTELTHARELMKRLQNLMNPGKHKWEQNDIMQAWNNGVKEALLRGTLVHLDDKDYEIIKQNFIAHDRTLSASKVFRQVQYSENQEPSIILRDYVSQFWTNVDDYKNSLYAEHKTMDAVEVPNDDLMGLVLKPGGKEGMVHVPGKTTELTKGLSYKVQSLRAKVKRQGFPDKPYLQKAISTALTNTRLEHILTRAEYNLVLQHVGASHRLSTKDFIEALEDQKYFIETRQGLRLRPSVRQILLDPVAAPVAAPVPVTHKDRDDLYNRIQLATLDEVTDVRKLLGYNQTEVVDLNVYTMNPESVRLLQTYFHLD